MNVSSVARIHRKIRAVRFVIGHGVRVSKTDDLSMYNMFVGNDKGTHSILKTYILNITYKCIAKGREFPRMTFNVVWITFYNSPA